MLPVVVHRPPRLQPVRFVRHAPPGIRIPTEPREIGARDLQPDPVSLQKNIPRDPGIHSRKIPSVELRADPSGNTSTSLAVHQVGAKDRSERFES